MEAYSPRSGCSSALFGYLWCPAEQKRKARRGDMINVRVSVSMLLGLRVDVDRISFQILLHHKQLLGTASARRRRWERWEGWVACMLWKFGPVTAMLPETLRLLVGSIPCNGYRKQYSIERQVDASESVWAFCNVIIIGRVG